MSGPGEATVRVFDRRLLRLRRARAAGRDDGVTFLRDEVADRLAERLDDIRQAFPVVLDLGCGDGALGRRLAPHLGIERLVSADLGSLPHASPPGLRLVADEEMLPFAADSLDAIVSAMALHWVNDLPGTLAQIRWCLKADGLFLAAFPGGDTLHELRGALLRAELELTGGASPRVSPFVDLRDAAALLQRAGLALPVADVDRLTVTYGEPLRLLAELRAMGETSALAPRGRPLARAVLARAMHLYRRDHGDSQGRVPATFDILFLAGWKPHASQQAPAPRGSGKVGLASALPPPKRP
ncbi:MAG TPA: methyltransferase domain-containing protein [Geminicoccaceae bacterium]|nr:methyltransferase domain-containing protein [Geminicoccus sp.]HMU50443.1 methyltransferase domain-containing protein [Geminicoccaceae bacterium]